MRRRLAADAAYCCTAIATACCYYCPHTPPPHPPPPPPHTHTQLSLPLPQAREYIAGYARAPARTVGSVVLTDLASGRSWEGVDVAEVSQLEVGVGADEGQTGGTQEGNIEGTEGCGWGCGCLASCCLRLPLDAAAANWPLHHLQHSHPCLAQTHHLPPACRCRLQIHFGTIPEASVAQLIAEGEVFWCAGGLMVEHALVQPHVVRMEGSLDSVMGLDKRLLLRLLCDAGAAQEP